MDWLTLSITLLLVLDPFGNIPVLVSLLESVPPERRRRVIVRECIVALVILLVFLFAGTHVMNALGLEQPALSVAGGVVLMLIALRLLFPGRGGVMGEEIADGEPFIVPLATPLIAGPSAIASVILLHDTSAHWMSTGLIAVGLAWAVTAGVLCVAPELFRFMGKRLVHAIERLTGLLLTVIAVQMMLSGIEMFIKTLER